METPARLFRICAYIFQQKPGIAEVAQRELFAPLIVINKTKKILEKTCGGS
jgi:hypothetical protein